MAPRSVAIVGCGAAGALMAAALLREARGRALQLTIVEPRSRLGRGIAYSTPDPLHLLNVPADSMSAIESDPTHFLRWAQRYDEGIEAADFLPRREFGAYLEETLAAAIAAAPVTTVVDVLRDSVERIDAGVATLGSGGALSADEFVLALGNGPVRQPARVAPVLFASGRYVANPWRTDPRRIAGPDERVLLVGTGLTMVDVALSLAHDERPPRMLAVSRNGLGPRTHRPGQPRDQQAFPLPAGHGDLATLLRGFFVELGRVGRYGGDASDVVDSLRPVAQTIWIRLGSEERRWFLANLRRQWEVHRHRMAPAVGARLQELQASGALAIEGAAVTALVPSGDGVLATLQRDGRSEHLRFDRVVNCAGPEDDVSRFGTEPVRSLLAAGSASRDPLGLGLEVDLDGAVLGADGRPTPGLHAVGPLRKGSLWESTAVPEIRRQAADLARHLFNRRRTGALAAETA
jgi:uncharacterized NAD(P)/FAD-binding protein YdhS